MLKKHPDKPYITFKSYKNLLKIDYIFIELILRIYNIYRGISYAHLKKTITQL